MLCALLSPVRSRTLPFHYKPTDRRRTIFAPQDFVKLSVVVLCGFGLMLCHRVLSATVADVIPVPVSVMVGGGEFQLSGRTKIGASTQTEVSLVSQYLQGRLKRSTGFTVPVLADAADAEIRLLLNEPADALLGVEGYRLTVTPEKIVINANAPAGLFYGVQTLLQLLPPAVEGSAPVREIAWKVPESVIIDYPRFGWRGLMLDVARHFFTKPEVEGFIDEMVKYKFNLLHLHLTDDEGWRIQIKSLPRLTEVGAWNVQKVGYFGTFPSPGPDEPRDHGGFYTQDDIKEIVQYAKDRFVNVLPEIDVPGHSLAAVVSYPEISGTPGAAAYRVGSGEPTTEWTADNTPVALEDNTLGPANEKSYEFLDKVLTEVAPLFPFEYIHLGGDECSKNFWVKNEAIKALMVKEGLKDMDAVQGYFERRCRQIVESKGKKFMGWDEILQDDLSPDAAIMSWQSVQAGVRAARQKHAVVMSPFAFAYLDHAQGDAVIEPHVYASLRLQECYAFEPAPDGVDARYILGGQGNIWTEQIYNTRHLQYMVWPRALAVAECVWSPKEKKDWRDFSARVEQQFPRFEAAQVKYAPSLYDPAFNAEKMSDGALKITLATEANDLEIYYSFDNSFPDLFYPRYTGPLIAPKEAAALKVITYRGGKPMGRMITMPLAELEKRVEEAKRKKPSKPEEE